MRLTVRVPATSANLGPGFDSFGLALDLCNEVTVDTDAAPGVTWEGEGADELPTDGTDVVSEGIRAVALRVGGSGSSRGIAMHGTNRIPMERGLGSSSAAAVAGVVLGFRVLGHAEPDPHTVFSIAAELEGHPDNAAPAVFGGFTIAMPGGSVRRLEPHPRLRAVVLVPTSVRLATADARAALPDEVPIGAAVSNVAHAALTVVALTQDPSLLVEALADRIHQPYRLPLIPAVREVFDDLVAEGVPVCLSGAGPSLLAFDRPGRDVPDPDDGWQVLRPAIRAGGFELVED